MYSVFCGLAIIFVIFLVPETKGRDLDEIAKLFVKNRRQSVQSSSVDATKHSTVCVTSEKNSPQKSALPKIAANGINGNESEITKL